MSSPPALHTPTEARSSGSARSHPLIGVDNRCFPETDPQGPLQTLERASELGLDGVFFRTVTDISPDLDLGLLGEAAARADALGLYLETGLGKVNPYMMGEWPELRSLGDGDVVRGFRRAMTACAAMDCRELWVGTANFKLEFPGRYGYDRFRTDVTWSDQLTAIERFLLTLAPIARDLGVRLNLETHEEITSFEILRLIEGVGSDVLGVVFDTANGLRRIEHPLHVARRVAPYVHQTHIKDASLTRTDCGAVFQVRPCGLGVVEFGPLLEILLSANPDLHLTLEGEKMRTPSEGEPVTMLLEIDDPEFREAHPDLSTEEWHAYTAMLDRYEAQVRSGDRPSNADWGAQPWGYAESVAGLRQSAAYLRSVLPERSTTPVTAELGE